MSFNTLTYLVEFAAFCRWFDQPITEFLVETNSKTSSLSKQDGRNWFDWLVARDYVVKDEHYRIDDVARDSIRTSSHRVNRKKFCDINLLLSEYFGKLADDETSNDNLPPLKYDNSDWRKYTIEKIYHSLFANRNEGQSQLLTHFFEGSYLQQPDIAISALFAIYAEADPKEYALLPKDTRHFLVDISLAVLLGHYVINKSEKSYKVQANFSEKPNKNISEIIKSEIESSLNNCFKKSAFLDGFAKYSCLISQSIRSYQSQAYRFAKQAEEIALEFLDVECPEFGSRLLHTIGHIYIYLNFYQDALDIYNKITKFDSSYWVYWNNRGVCLGYQKKNQRSN